MVKTLIPVVVFVSLTASAAADVIGSARVIDGDTIEIDGTRIRLFGIDAPETRQLCELQGEFYRCGEQAARVLAERLGTRPLICHQRTTDRYGRAVAVCFQDDEDIGAWLVSTGWALSFRKYTEAYLWLEQSAQHQKRGMWQGSFEPPWEWRKKK